MQKKFLAALLVTFAGFSAAPVKAETIAISNAQLSQIVAGETVTVNTLNMITQYEAYLAQPSLPRNTLISVDYSLISFLQQAAKSETQLDALYREARLTSLIPVQTLLLTQFNTLLQDEKTLLSVYTTSDNKQIIASQMLSILSTEHAIASSLVQKQALMLSSLPPNLTTQVEVQYADWSKIINYMQIQEQLALH